MVNFRAWALAGPPRWLLLADDLSGACDAAVGFVAAGFSTEFLLHPRESEAELAAFSTETRPAEAEEAADRVRQAVNAAQSAGRRLIYKKIDSVLRGQVEAETLAALETTEFERAVLCPALPAQERVVRNGALLVHSQPSETPMPDDPRIETPDGADEAALEALAAELLDREPPALPVGSAGLAFAWAAALGGLLNRKSRSEPPPRSHRPPKILIGSHNPASLKQLEYLNDPSLATYIEMRRDDFDIGPVAAGIRAGEIGSLVLSGGATARVMLGKLGAEAIRVRGEAISGAPWGTIVGGAADGLPVVTKSGGFGEPDALARIRHSLLKP